ncbi:MAG: hypothetical protein MI863_06520 [Desulfobacterales bacterium]|nr:hypothetical protein [Desulfobacterales bacterium]
MKNNDTVTQILAALAIVTSILCTLYETAATQKRLEAKFVRAKHIRGRQYPVLPCLVFNLNNKKITDLVELTVMFENTGSPISIIDIKSPVTIVLKNIESIVLAEVIDPQPGNIGVTATVSGNCVVISKSMLNQGDRFFVNIVCETMKVSDHYISGVHARIKGLDQIHSTLNPGERHIPTKYAPYVITISFYLFFCWVLFRARHRKKNSGDGARNG